MKGKTVYSKVVKKSNKLPWIVMIHGFTGNHTIFESQINEFEKNFNILLFDLRGHGESSSVPGPFGREEYSDDLELLIEKYELKKFYIWGTHTGAAIALIYTLRHSETVAGLILEGTPLPGYVMPRLAELVERAETIAVQKSISEAKKDWLENADWFKYMNSHPEECRANEHKFLIDNFEGETLISKLIPR